MKKNQTTQIPHVNLRITVNKHHLRKNVYFDNIKILTNLKSEIYLTNIPFKNYYISAVSGHLYDGFSLFDILPKDQKINMTHPKEGISKILQNPMLLRKNLKIRSVYSRSLFAAILGTLPGLNWLYHKPETGAGISVFTGMFFYTQAALLLYQKNHVILFNRNHSKAVSTRTLRGGMIGASLIHAIFTYFFTLNDLIYEFEKKTGVTLNKNGISVKF